MNKMFDVDRLNEESVCPPSALYQLAKSSLARGHQPSLEHSPIVLGPSGCGKSTYVAQFPALVLDGDQIAYRDVALPPEWWKGERAASIHHASQSNLLAYCGKRVLLWWTSLNAGRPGFIREVSAIALPPVHDVYHWARNRAEQRAEAGLPPQGSYVSVEALSAIYGRTAELALAYGVPMFQSLDLAVQFAYRLRSLQQGIYARPRQRHGR